MIRKWAYFILATICLIIGVIAFFLPLLPAFPFLLLTLILYMKSSEKMYQWFIQTQLYHQTLKSYLEGKGLTLGSKLKLMLSITVSLSIGAYFSRNIKWILILLLSIWCFHVIYFSFFVKTKSQLEPETSTVHNREG